MDPTDLRHLLVFASTFGLVFCCWLIIVMIWSMRRSVREDKIRHRLAEADGAAQVPRVLRLWHDGEEVSVEAPHAADASWLQRMRCLPREAGLDLPIQSLLLAAIGSALAVCAVAMVLTQSVLTALAAAGLILLACWTLLNFRINKQKARFEQQFVDALDLISRSLRAGHPLNSAFSLIAEELDPPVSEMFAEICQQQTLGMSMESALQHAAARSSSGDVKLFAAAVSIQLRSGGNLADMMHRLAAVIRERIRLSRRVQVLTTQTQFSKRVLMALPFFTFLLLNLLNPDYMAPLYATPVGHILIAIALTGLAAGSFVMNRIAKLRY
jgi:tight adherence protein B